MEDCWNVWLSSATSRTISWPRRVKMSSSPAFAPHQFGKLPFGLTEIHAYRARSLRIRPGLCLLTRSPCPSSPRERSRSPSQAKAVLRSFDQSRSHRQRGRLLCLRFRPSSYGRQAQRAARPRLHAEPAIVQGSGLHFSFPSLNSLLNIESAQMLGDSNFEELFGQFLERRLHFATGNSSSMTGDR